MDITLTGRYYQPKDHLKYFVTEDGEIYRKLSGQRSNGVYTNYSLGKSNVYLHRLMCTLWHGEPEPNQVARHLDNDPSNNHPTNLAWGNKRDNSIDTRDANYSKQQKITAEIAEEIRELQRIKPYGYAQIAAKRYGICPSHASDIANRRVWND